MNGSKDLLENNECPVRCGMIHISFTDDFPLTPDGLRYADIMEALEPETVVI